jgi:hypothetical protein
VIETDDTQDILMLKLSKALIKCCDELGNLGCDGCPVRAKCRCLWQRVENSVTHNLDLTEYRRLSQKFYILRQERNQILEKRGRKAPKEVIN